MIRMWLLRMLVVTVGLGSLVGHSRLAQAAITAPVSYFELPSDVAGRLTPNVREGTGGVGNWDQPARLTMGSPRVYLYQSAPALPPFGASAALYVASVYDTSEDARQGNVKNRDASTLTDVGVSNRDMAGAMAPLLPIARPVAVTEWLRGHLSPIFAQWNARECYAVGGVRYQNVTIFVQDDNFGRFNHNTPTQPAQCAATYAWVTHVLTALYTRAVAYTQGHFAAVPSPAQVAAQAAQRTFFPPASVFNYPDMGSYNGNVYTTREKGVIYDLWALTPGGFTGDVTADYDVNIYPNVAAAQRANTTFRTKLLGTLGAFAPLVALDWQATPLRDPAFHVWGAMIPAIHCNMSAGFVYHNIQVLISFSSQDDLDTCAAKIDWLQRLATRLVISMPSA